MNKRVCWPTLRQWKKTLSVLNKKEKIVFAVFVSLISLSLFYIIFVKPSFSDIPTPTEGGTYVEGMIGQPRYINPILSDNSKVDKDIYKITDGKSGGKQEEFLIEQPKDNEEL